mmetsp:Transcript_24523/g.70461  ORF Transcript_24523/g.70461 Transcript_24523/m.70461 type:complete len:214 (+) Transcript_24523:304-945(+)
MCLSNLATSFRFSQRFSYSSSEEEVACSTALMRPISGTFPGSVATHPRLFSSMGPHQSMGFPSRSATTAPASAAIRAPAAWCARCSTQTLSYRPFARYQTMSVSPRASQQYFMELFVMSNLGYSEPRIFPTRSASQKMSSRKREPWAILSWFVPSTSYKPSFPRLIFSPTFSGSGLPLSKDFPKYTPFSRSVTTSWVKAPWSLTAKKNGTPEE